MVSAWSPLTAIVSYVSISKENVCVADTDFKWNIIWFQ